MSTQKITESHTFAPFCICYVPQFCRKLEANALKEKKRKITEELKKYYHVIMT